MNGAAPHTCDTIAATYLQHLQELAYEISAATDAIAANAMTRFKESVAKQEMLCASLASMAASVSEGLRSPEESTVPGIDTTIKKKIQAANETLRDLNLQYAALLRHSGKSIALLALLCKSHTGQFQEARGPRLKHQTWSCEM